MYGISTASGKRAWSYRTGGPVRSAPAISGQTISDFIYAGSDDGNLYAFGIDGNFRWQFATSGPVTAGPVFGGEVCVCDTRGKVFGLFIDGPPESWEKSVGGAVNGTPSITGTILYIGTAGSAVSAMNLDGGTPSYWHYTTSGPVNSGLASNGTTVYAGDDHGYLYALDVSSPGSVSLRWRYRVGAAIQSQILLAGNVVYFGSLDHHVYALRA